MRHCYKPPHKIRELREVSRLILGGLVRDIRFGFGLHFR